MANPLHSLNTLRSGGKFLALNYFLDGEAPVRVFAYILPVAPAKAGDYQQDEFPVQS
jgi:hypothetical protein